MVKKRKPTKKTQIGKQLNLFGEPEASKPEKLVSKPEPIKKSPAKKKKKKLELENYFEIAADTGQLIKEPEFDGFYFNPIEFASEIGPLLSSSSVIDLTKLKKTEKKGIMSFIDAMLDQEYFFENWYDRLEFLLVRAKDQGKNDLEGKVAAILKLIEKKVTIEDFFSIGLFTALLDRNIRLGLEFIELYDSGLGRQVTEMKSGSGDLDIEVAEAFKTLDKKYPGLIEYLNEINSISQSVMDVAQIFSSAKVILGLFKIKQLEEGNKLIKDYLTKNFGLQFQVEPFLSEINQLDEQQLLDFQLFLNKLMESYLSDDLLDTIYDRVEEILNKNIYEMDDQLFDVLDEFLEQIESFNYLELLLLLSSIFIGELTDYFQRKMNGGFYGDSNILPLN